MLVIPVEATAVFAALLATSGAVAPLVMALALVPTRDRSDRPPTGGRG